MASPADADDTPIQNFSQCHEGILSHLRGFGELPALLAPAARARALASDILGFFRQAVFEHHAEEERELFPAVLASAAAGEERARVQAIVERLTREHRQVERAWAQLEPEIRRVAKGQDSELDGAAVTELVATYGAHARYEEAAFLPLSQEILSRNANHMAALGVSLHMRHVLPDVLARYAGRI